MSDPIDRQAAIDAICKHGTDLERRGITVLSVANHKQATVDLLENLPSAERLGTWTTRRTMYHDGETYCDQCGWTWEDITHGRINVTRTPFCPNCGARMRMTRE